MQYTPLLPLFLLLSFTSAQAQPLIPWLGANGKYGYATEEGRVVVQPSGGNMSIRAR